MCSWATVLETRAAVHDTTTTETDLVSVAMLRFMSRRAGGAPQMILLHLQVLAPGTPLFMLLKQDCAE
jgi:hypothetical protein